MHIVYRECENMEWMVESRFASRNQSEGCVCVHKCAKNFALPHTNNLLFCISTEFLDIHTRAAHTAYQQKYTHFAAIPIKFVGFFFFLLDSTHSKIPLTLYLEKAIRKVFFCSIPFIFFALFRSFCLFFTFRLHLQFLSSFRFERWDCCRLLVAALFFCSRLFC